MSPRSSDRADASLPVGTLDMLILRTLTLGPLHGYAIAQHIAQISDGVLSVEQGSLYPALERLLNQGWVTAKWAESPTKRQARYYTITRAGHKQLHDRVEEYDRVSAAIARILRHV
ncbi:MAG TPA: PadR family transcriptional regulator [Gemmatimonadaceae bacterium]|nr:PadR family transcriptional regulator [Gemmatimonadaceae bacterium]